MAPGIDCVQNRTQIFPITLIALVGGRGSPKSKSPAQIPCHVQIFICDGSPKSDMGPSNPMFPKPSWSSSSSCLSLLPDLEQWHQHPRCDPNKNSGCHSWFFSFIVTSHINQPLHDTGLTSAVLGYHPVQEWAACVKTVTTHVCAKLLQSRTTLCDPMDYSLPVSSAHGILQARVLASVAILFSRGLLNPGIKPGSPTLQADSLPSEPTGKPITIHKHC